MNYCEFFISTDENSKTTNIHYLVARALHRIDEGFGCVPNLSTCLSSPTRKDLQAYLEFFDSR